MNIEKVEEFVTEHRKIEHIVYSKWNYTYICLHRDAARLVEEIPFKIMSVRHKDYTGYTRIQSFREFLFLIQLDGIDGDY